MIECSRFSNILEVNEEELMLHSGPLNLQLLATKAKQRMLDLNITSSLFLICENSRRANAFILRSP